MKSILTLAFIMAANANAFTLDFILFNGAVIPPTPLIVPVFGYGDVKFEAGEATPGLEVGNQYKNDAGTAITSLEMDAGEQIIVTFLGDTPYDVDFDVIGAGFADSPLLFAQLGPKSFSVTVGGPNGDGAGLQSVSWVIPEPSSALLCSFSALALAFRRRR